ncbi:hypothetical protein BDF19DRAFT_424637 [Syncephalis fuscata]|nr:hypothetical protein BDF19DRAFT_424637 [Syncephalis fuscata]
MVSFQRAALFLAVAIMAVSVTARDGFMPHAHANDERAFAHHATGSDGGQPSYTQVLFTPATPAPVAPVVPVAPVAPVVPVAPVAPVAPAPEQTNTVVVTTTETTTPTATPTATSGASLNLGNRGVAEMAALGVAAFVGHLAF